MRFESASRRGLQATAVLGLSCLALAAGGTGVDAQSLVGSHESLMRQNLVAAQHDYAYLRTPHDVVQAVDGGVLIPVRGNGDFELAEGEVSFPYARPEVKAFLTQLSHEYRAVCGEVLVVTSLTRPTTHQPWNASPLSVHPTGMAVDMRRSDRRACRDWLDATLLALEGEGMIEATREHWPSHYHVAVFPDPLLLPGPIGDPNGLVRLASLHHRVAGSAPEAEDETAGVRVVRARNGRMRITQGGQGAIARRAAVHSGRIALRRHTAGARRAPSRSAPGHHASRQHAVAAVNRHRGSRSGGAHGTVTAR